MAVFIPLTIASVLFNIYTGTTVAEQNKGNAVNAFSQLYDIFASRIDTVRQDVMLIQLDPNIRQLLQEPLTQENILTLVQKKAQMNSTLDHIENKRIWGFDLRVFLPENRQILVDDNRFFNNTPVHNEQWYQALIHSPYKNQWIYAPDPARNIAFSYLVRIVKATDFKETTAVIRMDFQMSEVLNTLQQSLPLIDGAIIYLTTDDGRIILHASVGDHAVPSIPLAPDISYSIPHTMMADINTQHYLVQAQQFKYQPWIMVMLLPQASNLELLLGNERWITLLLIAFLCGVIIFALTFLFTNRIVSRITEVSIGMSNLKGGELERLPQPEQLDEIGMLVESYNYLTDELKMLNTVRAMADANRKHAEFVALQAQINPHFLYNTLEMINYFAMIGDAKQVERIVMLLSRFYKRCLNHGTEYASLAQELELTETYFSIQEIRYNGKVRLEQNIPEALMGCEVPHIILQPIVENAIHHGIMNTQQQKGTIRISGTCIDDILILSVSDDGAGIPEDKLQLLSHGLEFTHSMIESGSHYGLHNIDKRLKNLYGEAYGLQFESKLHIGSTVKIILPIQ